MKHKYIYRDKEFYYSKYEIIITNIDDDVVKKIIKCSRKRAIDTLNRYLGCSKFNYTIKLNNIDLIKINSPFRITSISLD